MEGNNGRYETTSLDLAAYLLCIGAKLEAISGNPPDSKFRFSKVTEEQVSEYWAGSAKANPQGILQAYKHLAHRARESSGRSN